MGLSLDGTIHGTIGAQRLVNALAGTKNAIIDVGKLKLLKGITAGAEGRALGSASLLYNSLKLAEHPSWGRGLATVVSGLSLVPGGMGSWSRLFLC